ncbi:GNAT family N-acetyltransferase [Culicoidibacter larvae]|uniref:GNAT family N-acetyltransferase n=1 Tax=Culicoidibacter larvae TaxID=2579976 RepID=A0A5R8QCQ8_9FIRM|nr:GNAT family N-acetyltransferase [Culicoidibacter larvae]TLG74292.1 GNAT family N-acetyltransferase [Culicoidibacter larvae]
MNMNIRKAEVADIDAIAQLYDDLNDALAAGINYPKWKKGIYPVRQTAIDGLATETLYVLTLDNVIAGSVILNHQPEAIYRQVNWQIDAEDQEVIIIYTLVVHPLFRNKGVAKALLDFAVESAHAQQLKAVRLDVEVGNLPAVQLYEAYGFIYIDTLPYPIQIPELIELQLSLYEYLVE